MIRVLAETLSVPLSTGHAAGNRPPCRLLLAPQAIRQCDELPWNTGPLGQRIGWAAHRSAALGVAGGHPSAAAGMAEDLPASFHTSCASMTFRCCELTRRSSTRWSTAGELRCSLGAWRWTPSRAGVASCLGLSNSPTSTRSGGAHLILISRSAPLPWSVPGIGAMVGGTSTA
jgi:hypothetical protein